MKSQSTEDYEIRSLDLRHNAQPGGVTELRNWRWRNEGWCNDVGWEPLIPRSSWTIPTADLEAELSPVRHLSIWQRHQGAEVYYLQERAGVLYFEYGNIGAAASRRVELDTGRHDPKPDEPGTQLAPFGRNALLCNGHDAPLWWRGRNIVRPFGWSNVPAAPVLLTPYPSAVLYTVATGQYTKVAGELPTQQTCVIFETTDPVGVGDRDGGDFNQYGWRVAFRSDTGSVSPWSAPVYVSWELANNAGTTDERGGQGVVLDAIPIGPKGTVSRLIYRTRNMGDGTTGAEVWYLVREIRDNVSTCFVDVVPDHLLVDEVQASESVSISQGFTVAAAWNGHLWIGGGQADSTLLRYSKRLAPEQFPRDNYFELGVREGGGITALVPFYDVLLVFRERSVDVVRAQGNGDVYTATTLSSDTGTTATNTITVVPGVGILFLAPGGIYRITGGLTGGAVYNLERVSDMLEPELRRVSVSALARATAAYSPREREWWVHYPVDGDTENSRGLVLHLEVMGWSRRSGGMDFTQLAVNDRGYFVIGTYPEYNSASPTASTGAPGWDLQVWSAIAAAGTTLGSPSTVEENTTFTVSAGATLTSVLASAWHTMGSDRTYKQVHNVELQGLATGNAALSLEYATDWSPAWTTEPGQRRLMPGEHVLEAGAPHTYRTDSAGAQATWGSSTWGADQVVRTRWDVAPRWLRAFRWRLSTSSPVHAVRYALQVALKEAKVLGGRA